jgi:hypothetical protein
VQTPCEKSIITYVSSLFDALPKSQANNKSQIQNEKQKKGIQQEYSMLIKSLNLWLNYTINNKQYDSKSTIPNDFVELKSLIADLKTFRLEEYHNKQKERNKINSIHSELQNYLPKQASLIMDPNEDIKILDRLWDKLDQTIQNREAQLEKAILSWDKNQKKYEMVSQATKSLNQSLNLIREQIGFCIKRLENSYDSNRNNSNTSDPVMLNDEIRNHFERIKESINSNEGDIRKNLIHAYQLQEESYPNSNVLIQGLEKLEQITIDLLVTISSPMPAKISNNNNTSQNFTLRSVKQSKKSNKKNRDKSASPTSNSQSLLLTTSNSSGISSTTTNLSSDISNSSNTDHLFTPVQSLASRYYDSSAVSTPISSASNTSASYNITNSPVPTVSYSKTNGSNKSLNKLVKQGPLQSKLWDLLIQSIRWIESKKVEAETIQFKPDIVSNDAELAKIRSINMEINKFNVTLEQIESLKSDHPDTNELSLKLEELFSSLNHLCETLQIKQKDLESLKEFNRLVQDELRYIGEMEDIELNRDWSQPKKFKSSELIQHKLNVELTLNHKKNKLNEIYKSAERLLKLKHPASVDINAYVSTLKTNTSWLHQLMNILNVHIIHLQDYEEFNVEFKELNSYLNDSSEKFQELCAQSIALNPTTTNSTIVQDFVNKFNIFKHNFQTVYQFKTQFDNLYDFANKLPSYKMRKMVLKPPFNKAQILTDYFDCEFTIPKNEVCLIEDNSNQIKWKVVSLVKNRQALVPSVCFVLNGPDPELMEMIDK